MNAVRFALVVVCLVVRCQHSENRYRDAPPPSALEGRWELTAAGRDGLKSVSQGSSPFADEQLFVVLRGNNTCEMRLLVHTRMPGISNPSVVNSPCQWRLGNDDHDFIEIEPLSPFRAGAVRLYFGESAGDTVLWQYADDPDQWKYVEFARVRPNSP
jgi:hypothetical protein